MGLTSGVEADGAPHLPEPEVPGVSVRRREDAGAQVAVLRVASATVVLHPPLGPDKQFLPQLQTIFTG